MEVYKEESDSVTENIDNFLERYRTDLQAGDFEMAESVRQEAIIYAKKADQPSKNSFNTNLYETGKYEVYARHNLSLDYAFTVLEDYLKESRDWVIPKILDRKGFN